MNYVTIRDNIVNTLDAGWVTPGVKVFYGNAEEIDLNEVGDAFIRCKIRFQDARQMDVAENPSKRIVGVLNIEVLTRETLGTRVVLGYMDTLSNLFDFKNLGGVQMQAAAVGDTYDKDGWSLTPLKVPFYANQLA